jgi:hypothetical protein
MARRAATVLGVLFMGVGVGCEDDTGALDPTDGGGVDVGIADAGGPPDAGARRDGGPRDLGLGVECQRAEDCPADFTPFSLDTCPGRGWSCLAGSCTWDCTLPGRTCTLVEGPAGERCIECDDAPNVLICPDQPCATPPLAAAQFEMPGMCARLFHVDVVACQASFAWLREAGLPDRLCAVALLATGLERAVLSCGFCQEQVVWF